MVVVVVVMVADALRTHWLSEAVRTRQNTAAAVVELFTQQQQ